jgi:predicted RNase H-like HicB family nuclease
LATEKVINDRDTRKEALENMKVAIELVIEGRRIFSS